MVDAVVDKVNAGHKANQTDDFTHYMEMVGALAMPETMHGLPSLHTTAIPYNPAPEVVNAITPPERAGYLCGKHTAQDCQQCESDLSEKKGFKSKAEKTGEEPAKCSMCNWTNVGLLNLIDSSKAIELWCSMVIIDEGTVRNAILQLQRRSDEDRKRIEALEDVVKRQAELLVKLTK